ncbi:IS110 family transposase [Paraburkholderia mimosarum]|uniref:IS110 family transposase n=1 Tax=Paraburkholderia mimosarum TaxID=312026 RepID=UPI00040F2C6D|nr:IS110 family transposase [Paraburkholderia mimosarum]
MNKFSKYVGLDVHQETAAVAVADTAGEVRYVGEIVNTPEAIAKLVAQLKRGTGRLAFCYEADPCGYTICRQLRELKQDCQVVAPSLIPRKPGERVKTDRRDALSLARLYRAGELSPVWIPDQAEALRDLTRAREDLKHLQRQAKQRLLSFLSRHGHRYTGRSRWTQAHWRWLEGIRFARPEQQIVLQEYIDTVQACGGRVVSLDREVETAAHASPAWPVIEALMALRRICLLAAVTVIAELGDLARFAGAPQLMAYLGLVPSEHSSGKRERRGAITKTGNSHVRRVLVEAAWTYRHAARKTAILQRRAERTPPEVQEIAWSTQKRLCQRFRNLMAHGKLKSQVCTAIARELVEFIWAIGQHVAPLKHV